MPIPEKTTRTVTMVISFQRRFLYITESAMLPVFRRDDGILSLVAAHGGARHFYPDLVRNLDLDRLVVQLGNLPVDAARGDDLVADLERGLELFHLLLPPLHRHQDQEIEDAEDKGKWQK